MDSRRGGTAQRTIRSPRRWTCQDDEHAYLGFGTLDKQPTRRQRKIATHDRHPPTECRSCSAQIAPTLSQSRILTPPRKPPITLISFENVTIGWGHFSRET